MKWTTLKRFDVNHWNERPAFLNRFFFFLLISLQLFAALARPNLIQIQVLYNHQLLWIHSEKFFPKRSFFVITCLLAKWQSTAGASFWGGPWEPTALPLSANRFWTVLKSWRNSVKVINSILYIKTVRVILVCTFLREYCLFVAKQFWWFTNWITYGMREKTKYFFNVS